MATKAMPVQPAINIRVFRNGDEFCTGKRFVISTRTTKDFDSFLNEVTSGLKASFGAVRKLHTPVNGHKIQDLSALENNNIYVAAGTEKFKKKSYTEQLGLSPRRLAAGTVKASTFAGPIQPVIHSKIRRSARIRHIYVSPKCIFVYRNGDDKELPTRMLLRYRALQNFETVLTEINGRVNLLNGVAVRRLYKMNGELVMDCSQLESESKYVAAGTERFKKVAYGQWEPSAPSPRIAKKPLPPIKAKPAPQKSSLPAKPKPTTVKKRPEKKKKRPEKSPEQKEADSVFHHKPTTVKRSREKDQHLNYDDDPNAVFKAKERNSETDGAREIEDTRETAVDLPIDQIAAEEVDEEIGGEDLPLTQESKSPESQQPRHETASPQKASAVPEQLPDDFNTEERKTHSPEEKPTMDHNYGIESPAKKTEVNTNNNAGNEDLTSNDGQQFANIEDRKEKDTTESKQIGEETFSERFSRNASPNNNINDSNITTEPTAEHGDSANHDKDPSDQDTNSTTQDDNSRDKDAHPATQDRHSPAQDNTDRKENDPIEGEGNDSPARNESRTEREQPIGEGSDQVANE